MLDLFTAKENICNLRNFRELYCQKKKTIPYSNETVTYKAVHLWELLPYDIKNSPTLIEFKNTIKTWSPYNCPCCLCKSQKHWLYWYRKYLLHDISMTWTIIISSFIFIVNSCNMRLISLLSLHGKWNLWMS